MEHMVHELAAEVWEAVDERRLPRLDSVRLYAAIGHHLLGTRGGYDPEVDRRVEYLRAVLKDLREGRRPAPDAVLHALVGGLCGRAEFPLCGKDRAAGAA